MCTSKLRTGIAKSFTSGRFASSGGGAADGVLLDLDDVMGAMKRLMEQGVSMIVQLIAPDVSFGSGVWGLDLRF